MKMPDIESFLPKGIGRILRQSNRGHVHTHDCVHLHHQRVITNNTNEHELEFIRVDSCYPKTKWFLILTRGTHTGKLVNWHHYNMLYFSSMKCQFWQNQWRQNLNFTFSELTIAIKIIPSVQSIKIEKILLT